MADELRAKLIELKGLLDDGLLTESEFQHQKSALLASRIQAHPAPSSAATATTGPSSLGGATTVGLPGQGSDAGLHGATMVASPIETNARPIPSVLGNYRILGTLGSGGMGTVVRARHVEEGWAVQQGGDVAIKLIHPEIAADESFRSRFLSEAALGKRVHHPGLAMVYDVVSDGPWLGTILELIEGEELTSQIRSGGLELEDVTRLLEPIASALDHLHENGIVHRDLKPANVKVRTTGQSVLLDLGIAKDLTPDNNAGHQTKALTAMGTSAWMAPEQADARNVTGAADRYALGLMTYALLSGGLPWPDDTTAIRALTNKMTGKLIPLEQARPGLPVWVYAAVDQALAVNPEDRPANAEEYLSALRGTGAAASRFSGSDTASETVPNASVAKQEPPPSPRPVPTQSRVSEPTPEQRQTPKAPASSRPVTPQVSPSERNVSGSSITRDRASGSSSGSRLWVGIGLAAAALLVVGGGVFSLLQSEEAASAAAATALPPELVLIQSTAETLPVQMPHVVVTNQQIWLDGEPLIALEAREEGMVIPESKMQGQNIGELYDRLSETFESREQNYAEAWDALSILTQQASLPSQLRGEIMVSATADAPFRVLRSVMYTAGQARFGVFQFTVDNPWMEGVRTIKSTLPMIGPPRSASEELGARSPLQLSVLVTDRGLSISGADAVLYPDGRPLQKEGDERPPDVACKSTESCAGVEDYDWAELSRQLGRIKDAYPDDLDIVVVPAPQTPMAVTVRALDTARWTAHLPLDAEQNAWEQWRTLRKPMFPTPVIAGGAL